MASRRDRPLTPRQYRQVLDAADTYREALIVRLCGETGIRPAELAAVTPGAVRTLVHHPPRYGLAVPDPTATTPVSVTDRVAYLPTALERSLRRYAQSNGVGEADRLFPVTPRRIQMVVAEVTSRAADRAREPALENVSSSDLRQFFARRALAADVNPRVVKAVGGWRSFEALEPYLPEPTPAEIAGAFESFEPGGGGPASPLETPDGTQPGDRTDRIADGRFHPNAQSPTLDPSRPPEEPTAALTKSILEASSHDEIERKACERVVDGRSVAAMIERTGSETTRKPVTAVDEFLEDREGALEALSVALEERAVDGATGELESPTDGVQATPSPTGPTGTVVTVPIQYRDTVYGTLATLVPEERSGTDFRTWIGTVGWQLGHAIDAVRRRRLLHADSLLELEFTCRDERAFLADVTGRLGCRITLDSLVSLDDRTHLSYIHLADGDPADVFERASADDRVRDCRLIETAATGSRLELLIGGQSPVITLLEYGLTVRELEAQDGHIRMTAQGANDIDVRTVVEGLCGAFPESELVGKRSVERPVQTAQSFRQGLEARLTDRQEAALRAAYFGGYYDWPRESTAEEVADAMGISSPTLHNHLRKGQQELLRTFFDDRAE